MIFFMNPIQPKGAHVARFANDVLMPALAEGIARVHERRATNNDKLHYGPVKIVVDGSIQGFTARLRWRRACRSPFIPMRRSRRSAHCSPLGVR